MPQKLSKLRSFERDVKILIHELERFGNILGRASNRTTLGIGDFPAHWDGVVGTLRNIATEFPDDDYVKILDEVTDKVEHARKFSIETYKSNDARAIRMNVSSLDSMFERQLTNFENLQEKIDEICEDLYQL